MASVRQVRRDADRAEQAGETARAAYLRRLIDQPASKGGR
jgi:hypothetical protein